MDVMELSEAAAALSPAERVQLTDAILRSLDPPDSTIDEQWGRLAEKRLHELRTGVVQPVDGKQLFEDLWKRFDV